MCVYIVFALMLPTVYFESEERTLHGRQLNPNNIGLKLGACSSEYFSSVLKCPLEEGEGEGGKKRIVLSSALCLAWLSRAIAVAHLVWISPSLSHSVNLGVLHAGCFCRGLGFAFFNGRKCPTQTTCEIVWEQWGGMKEPHQTYQKCGWRDRERKRRDTS